MHIYIYMIVGTALNGGGGGVVRVLIPLMSYGESVREGARARASVRAREPDETWECVVSKAKINLSRV